MASNSRLADDRRSKNKIKDESRLFYHESALACLIIIYTKSETN